MVRQRTVGDCQVEVGGPLLPVVAWPHDFRLGLFGGAVHVDAVGRRENPDPVRGKPLLRVQKGIVEPACK